MTSRSTPVIDPQTELWSEFNALEKADLDIRSGEERIGKQRNVIERLQERGCDTHEAERFLTLLHRTLAQWQQHRMLMLQRIAYLEARCADRAKVEPG